MCPLDNTTRAIGGPRSFDRPRHDPAKKRYREAIESIRRASGLHLDARHDETGDWIVQPLHIIETGPSIEHRKGCDLVRGALCHARDEVVGQVASREVT